MDLNKRDYQNKISEIRAKKQEKELEKLVKLADKKFGWIVLGSILFPISAYIYTGRWKALFITFLILFGCAFSFSILLELSDSTNNEKEADAFALVVGIGLIFYSLQDNISAVSDARKRIKELS